MVQFTMLCKDCSRLVKVVFVPAPWLENVHFIEIGSVQLHQSVFQRDNLLIHHSCLIFFYFPFYIAKEMLLSYSLTWLFPGARVLRQVSSDKHFDNLKDKMSCKNLLYRFTDGK